MAEAALYCSKGDAALLEGGMLDCSKGRCCASGWNCRANVYGSDTMSLLRRKILTRRLTTCAVVKDGEAVRLDLQNEAGGPVSLEMSLEQAQSLVMTLPHLLSKAFQARAQNPKARFVFGNKPSVHPDAIPFDMFCPEGFGHRGEDCTFETLYKQFAIRDSRVKRIAQIVHDADLSDDKFGRAEGQGLDRVLIGWAKQDLPDDDLLKRGMELIEGLYQVLA